MEKHNLEKDIYIFKKREIAQQTFLSWIEKGLLLVTLGFSIVSALAFMETHHYQKITITITRIVANCFIIIGFIFNLLALIQYRNKMKNIEKEYEPLFNLPLLMGIAVALLGILIITASIIHITV